MTKTQNKNDSHEAMEEAENHLQKPKLSKQEDPKRIRQEDIHKVANSRLGWYRRSGMNVVNFYQ